MGKQRRLNSAAFFSTICLISGAISLGLIASGGSSDARPSPILAVSAKVPGTISAIYVSKDEHVLEGQILAELDDGQYRAALLEARGALEASERRFEDAKEGLRWARRAFLLGRVGSEELESARSAFHFLERRLDLDRTRVERARSDLENTRIRAPATGVLASSEAEPGMSVPRGAEIFGLAGSSGKRSGLLEVFAYDPFGR